MELHAYELSIPKAPDSGMVDAPQAGKANSFFFFFFSNGFIATLFIYLFILAVLGLRFVRGPSLAAASGGHSSSWCGGSLFIPVRGPFTIAAPPAAGHRLQTRRLSSCGSRAQPLHWHVGSSQTRARTHVPRISRQIPNHCATREAQLYFFKKINLFIYFWLRWVLCCGERGLLFVEVPGVLTAVASLVAEHGL